MRRPDLAGAGKASKTGREKIRRIGRGSQFRSQQPGQARNSIGIESSMLPTGQHENPGRLPLFCMVYVGYRGEFCSFGSIFRERGEYLE